MKTHPGGQVWAEHRDSDDTSVAILEKSGPSRAQLHFHEKVTADNSSYSGIYPAKAVTSHQEHLSTLVARSLETLPRADFGVYGQDQALKPRKQDVGRTCKLFKPEFISVTRGPGIRTALACGLDTAKGLAVAWGIPIVGVNHMQAHALTPRLVCALDRNWKAANIEPGFPFLSLLVSGGHTLLVLSKGLWHHSILASASDIAVGNAIDKMARSILTPEVLDRKDIMYGRVLERYGFPNGASDYKYTAPASRAQEITPKATRWGWALPAPLAETQTMQFSFSGLGSAVKRICDRQGSGMGKGERTLLARESMRVAFEHLASRVTLALRHLGRKGEHIKTVVVCGGVASNGYLRAVYVNAVLVRNVR